MAAATLPARCPDTRTILLVRLLRQPAVAKKLTQQLQMPNLSVISPLEYAPL
jgi:hypothetical protein